MIRVIMQTISGLSRPEGGLDGHFSMGCEVC
jgi:hypothetical protein